SADVAVRCEGQVRDHRRKRLAAHDELDGCADFRVCALDVAHGDGAGDCRAETTRGDAADRLSVHVLDLGAFARGRATSGLDADTATAWPVRKLRLDAV